MLLNWSRKRNLVYLYDGPPPALGELPEGFTCLKVTPEVLEQYFSSSEDQKRRARYGKMFDDGAVGFLITNGTRWASIAWISPAESLNLPHHLSNSVSKHYPWMYNAHTHTDYRGLGLHGYLVRRRLQYAADRGGSGTANVASDVAPENTPSRRSYLRAGFTEAGLVDTVTLKLPRLPIKRWSWWHRKAQHSPLQQGGSQK